MVGLNQSPLLKALGWALLSSLWQMGLLWLVYHALKAVFHKAAARIRYGLALILLLTGAGWWLETFLSTGWSAATTPAASSITTTFIQPGFWPHLLQQAHGLLLAALPYASTLYLALLSILIFRYTRQYLATYQLTHEGYSQPSADLRDFVTAASQKLGIGSGIQLWLSSKIDTPITLGFLRPVILLPISIISQLTPGQLEAILIHELAHIRRKDYLAHLGITLIEGLLFFNPFCRMLAGYLKKEREHSCDDLVLEFQYDAHTYVSALLSLATTQQQQNQLAIAANGGDEQLLLQRAKRLLLPTQKSKGSKGRLATLFLLLTATIILISSPIHLFEFKRKMADRTTTPLPANQPEVEQPIINNPFVAQMPHSTGKQNLLHEPLLPAVPPTSTARANTTIAPQAPINRPAANAPIARANRPGHTQTDPVNEAGDEANTISRIAPSNIELTVIDLDTLPTEQIAQIQVQVLQQMETNLKQLEQQLDQRAAQLKLLTDKKKNSLQVEVTFDPQQQLLELQKQTIENQRKTLKIYQLRIDELQKKFRSNRQVIRIVYI